MTFNTSICAQYKSVDGWHVFTSDDLPGLYVASRNAEVAYNDIGPAIQVLLELDHGIQCNVAAEQPFAEFLRQIDGDSDTESDVIALSSRRFSVMGAVA